MDKHVGEGCPEMTGTEFLHADTAQRTDRLTREDIPQPGFLKNPLEDEDCEI